MKVTSDITKWRKFCDAIKEGNADTIQLMFNGFMSCSISIRDTFVRKEMKENFYHGMLLGLLKAEGNWIVESNAESGTGYTDIKLIVPSAKIGCIIEVKYAEKGDYNVACQKAVEQIEECDYEAVLRQEGMETVHRYGIACYKKTCRVVSF